MKILIIRYKKSTSILEGGEMCSQRNYNLLSSIAGSDNITTYYVNDENSKKTIWDYVRGGFYITKGYFWGLTPKRVSSIISMAKDYDVVFIDRSVFGIIAKALKKNQYPGKVISFFHNVEVPYFEAKLGKKRFGKSLILNCVDKNDGYACKYSDKVVALTERDDNDLYERYGRHADVRVPIALKDKYNRDSYPSEMTRKQPLCLFLGSYFPPNNEGIEWFMQNVYPFVNIAVKVVGKGMNKLRENYRIPDDVEIISDIPDLEPYFEAADIMVLPIFSGSGMKVKTCESMMYGKNIIATDEAFVGYNIDYEKVGAKCNTADEFIRAFEGFIENPRPRFNQYSRQTYLKKYSEEVMIDKFRSILNQD